MTENTQEKDIQEQDENQPEPELKEKHPPKKEKKDKMIKVKESEYASLANEAADFKDKYIRLFAEFENARKRMERDKIEFVKYANEDLLIDFLGLFDNLELSLQAAQQDNGNADALIKGIEMVLVHAQDILKKNGVTSIEAKGKPFDPHMHEILLQEENEEAGEGIVLEELQKGYRLGEKVIRTVKVKVSVKKQN